MHKDKSQLYPFDLRYFGKKISSKYATGHLTGSGLSSQVYQMSGLPRVKKIEKQS